MLKKWLTKESKKLLWSNESEFDELWKMRITVMASYIDISGVVADFGCGLMWLEPLLNQSNSYLPIDYIARDSRTLVLDLNVDQIPDLNVDIAFLSGILEYIKDVNAFINQLTNRNFKKIILSYCTLEKFNNINSRISLNWVSHISIFEILLLFTKEYDLIAIDHFNENTIFVFKKKFS